VAIQELIRGPELFFVVHYATIIYLSMILTFEHKGRQKYYESGSKSGIQSKHAGRL
jgi:hypothetical protein